MRDFQVDLVVLGCQAASVPCIMCAGAACWAVGSLHLQMAHERL